MVPEVKGIQDHIRAREAKNVMTMMMKIMLMTVRMFKVWMFKIDVRGRRTVSRGQKKAGNQPSLPGTFYFCHSNQCITIAIFSCHFDTHQNYITPKEIHISTQFSLCVINKWVF